ncbi:hypothetical protein OkiPb00172_07350 [Escherichia coli]
MSIRRFIINRKSDILIKNHISGIMDRFPVTANIKPTPHTGTIIAKKTSLLIMSLTPVIQHLRQSDDGDK